MPAHRYVEEIDLAAMLATKRLAGVAPDVNLMEHVTHKLPLSVNKVAHSGFEAQRRRHQKSKRGVLVAPQKGLMSYKIYFKKKKEIFHASIMSVGNDQRNCSLSHSQSVSVTVP